MLSTSSALLSKIKSTLEHHGRYLEQTQKQMHDDRACVVERAGVDRESRGQRDIFTDSPTVDSFVTF